MNWTEEQVLALISYSAHQAHLQVLAAARYWTQLGQTDSLCWGEGQEDEQVWRAGVDWTSARFTCSCAEGSHTCVHSAALLLWLVRAPAQFPQTAPPVWIRWWQADWPVEEAQLGGRLYSLPYWKAMEAIAEPNEPARLTRQHQGAASLAEWLRTLVEEGLPSVQYLFTSIWENRIANLFEHELPGLALALRQVETQRRSGAQAPDQLLAGLGELYLLTQAFLHWQELPPAEQPAVRLRAGVNQLAPEWVQEQQSAVSDTWLVLSQRTEKEAWFAFWHHRSTWLWGHSTGRYALVLESYHNSPLPPERVLPAGQYQGVLHFYPGAGALRAIPGRVWQWQEPERLLVPPGGSPWQLAYTYATAVAEQPWLTSWPVLLSPVLPVLTGTTDIQLLHASEQCLVPLRGTSAQHWQLLATGGGEPVAVFGEWDGQALLPLAQWALPVSTAHLTP
jgi:hypothetical protein